MLCLTLSFTDTMARTTTTVRPPWNEIEKTLKKAKKNKKKATLEYIIKQLPDENEACIKRGLNTGLHEIYELENGGYILKPEVKQEPKTVADRIEQVCKDAFLEKDKPSRQYIKKAMAEKYDYTNEAMIKKTLGLMVKSGKLIQEGQTFYAKGFKPEPEPEIWKPLPPDDKHYPHGNEGGLSHTFPFSYNVEITHGDERSFWKFLYNMYQLEVLYRETGDEDRAVAFNTAWSNMLDFSNHNYEKKDRYGNYIGIGHEDMSSNMEANDVKCLRDIYGVGASTVKLIEEWIETGKLKRLEDLKKKCSASVSKDIEFEAKKDYMPDFLKNLNELIEIYEKQGDFRATGLTKAAKSLDGHIITSVDDIEMFKLRELPGVGSSTIEMLKEYIQLGEIERLKKLRPETKANPDQVEWFATLTEEQAGYIQDWWDSEGEKKCGEENGVFGSCGIPFTFEYEGDTYKVDGDADEDEWEGRVHGISFEGTVYKNGVEHGSFSMRDEVEGFGREGDHAAFDLLNGEADEHFAEVCRDEFLSAYILQGSMAYKE